MQTREAFESAEPMVRSKALALRRLIIQSATEEGLSIEESLKWGQPSYKTPQGTPVRIGWSEESLSLFVNCNTSLISTFAERYSNQLKFVGGREIVFSIEEDLPKDLLKNCLRVAFHYHTPEQKRLRTSL